MGDPLNVCVCVCVRVRVCACDCFFLLLFACALFILHLGLKEHQNNLGLPALDTPAYFKGAQVGQQL